LTPRQRNGFSSFMRRPDNTHNSTGTIVSIAAGAAG
jgi:hypothetical protein